MSGKNKITFGLRNMHVAFEESPGVYGTPIAIPGAVSFAPSPEGESSSFFADDTRYFTTNANVGYSADLEMAIISDEVKVQMFGWEMDSNGAIVETADAIPKKFALMGEVQGDAKNRRFVYYDVQANRASKTEQTKQESVEPNPDVIPLTISPIMIGEKLLVKADLQLSSTNQLEYDSFFDEVYLPSFI